MKNRMIVAAWLLCVSVPAFGSLSGFGGTTGYMLFYDINGTGDGPTGNAYYNDFWGVPDLRTDTSDDLTFDLYPNQNTYNGSDSFWSNGSGDGNKWMIATTFREWGALGPGETEASLSFNVSAFDLDGRYSLTAFIKTLNPNAGFSVAKIDSVPLTGTLGTTTLSIDALTEGHILQIGFEMQGINANPATDWGSATATFESVEVIPEPASIALIGLAGGGILLFRRHIKI